ncbi:MAG: (d)CMP kinase [Candidatus Cloacimonetes bacterium]|nr:(d)CMP kinase [Candidatus Cloacimonadota bacterium]MDD4805362.1 (d)CMP kinase [Candidatus Cloacimonadota bacterium]
MMKRIIIAIDGPAASGKSTAAKLLATRLSYLYIDTGAMYRACALAANRAGIDISDAPSLHDLLANLSIEISQNPEGNIILLNDEDVSSLIRTPEISRQASAISAKQEVRERMVELQRAMGRDGGVVLDGRDIGTVVFPAAELKFFLIAPLEVRALRRQKELAAKGHPSVYEEVLAEMRERDAADSSRALAPLIPAKDAIHVDTQDFSIEEMVDALYDHYVKLMERMC